MGSPSRQIPLALTTVVTPPGALGSVSPAGHSPRHRQLASPQVRLGPQPPHQPPTSMLDRTANLLYSSHTDRRRDGLPPNRSHGHENSAIRLRSRYFYGEQRGRGCIVRGSACGWVGNTLGQQATGNLGPNRRPGRGFVVGDVTPGCNFSEVEQRTGLAAGPKPCHSPRDGSRWHGECNVCSMNATRTRCKAVLASLKRGELFRLCFYNDAACCFDEPTRRLLGQATRVRFEYEENGGMYSIQTASFYVPHVPMSRLSPRAYVASLTPCNAGPTRVGSREHFDGAGREGAYCLTPR